MESLLSGGVQAVLNNAMLYYGFLPKTWSYAGVLLARAGLSGEIWQTVIWVLLSSVVSLIVGLPWSAYRTFVLEVSTVVELRLCSTAVRTWRPTHEGAESC
mgnify:CR=1 FL=1